MSWEKILKKKIIVCCGSGGVGKTTISASIALRAAYEGKKVAVLTIDPAKRLATALGLESLGNTPKKIALPNAKGEMYAMMLDTKRTFDRLIEKYTKDPEKRKSILENRLYQHMSNMITGSQEYMAMERLHELFQEDKYDLLVLDTPPTRHALDFLEAPQKMIRLTESTLLKWFLKPGAFAGQVASGILGKGFDKILSVFDRLAGLGFLQELAEMVALIGSMLGGFHDRAEAVYQLLRKDFVGFFLVTSPHSVSVQDALYFHEKIKDYELPFLGFIINRVHRPIKWPPEASFKPLSTALHTKLTAQLENYDRLAARDEKTLRFLKKMGGKKSLYGTIPLLTKDVHDLEGLSEMSESLF